MTRAVVDDSGLTIDLPPRETTPEDEVMALWLWADTVSRVDAGLVPQLRDEASGRLSDIDLTAISSAYILWRAHLLADILGSDSHNAEKLISAARLPTSLDSPEDVLDTRGYLELRGTDGVDPDLTGRLESRLAATQSNDDLLVTSLVRSLELLGDEQATAGAVQQYEQRRDPGTGLVRVDPAPIGSVDATYLAGQLVPLDFATIAGADTVAALEAFLAAGGDPPLIEQLRAVAALRLAGDDGWEEHRAIVERGLEELRAQPWDRQTVGTVVDLVDALRVVEAAVPTVALQPFDVTDDESGYAARVALANGDIFTNRAELQERWSGLGQELLASALAPAEPAKLYYWGLPALVGLPSAPLTPEQRQEVSDQLSTFRGCPDFPELFRSTLASPESCDLDATRIALGSSFVDMEVSP